LLLIGLSIAAAIIASQALISGTFSLTRQAIQLGYFPRLKVLHTNPDQRGQIYLPLAVAVGVLIIMHTWKSGRTEIQEKVYSGAINELQLAVIARSKSITRVPGSAVFMAAMPACGTGRNPCMRS
jgi:K+ transporter